MLQVGFVLLSWATCLAGATAFVYGLMRGLAWWTNTWRWLIVRYGPEQAPSLWYALHQQFPLAMVALAIGAWFLLASVTELRLPVPTAPALDILHLGRWLTAAGLFGGALRVVYAAGTTTAAQLEAEQASVRAKRTKAPQGQRKAGTSKKTARAKAPQTRKASRNSPAKSS